MELLGKLEGNTGDIVWDVLFNAIQERGIEAYLVSGLRNNKGKKINGAWTKYNGKEIIVIDIESPDVNLTLAHELGHSVLHRDEMDFAAYDHEEEYHDRIEWEATFFGHCAVKLIKNGKELDLDAMRSAIKSPEGQKVTETAIAEAKEKAA